MKEETRNTENIENKGQYILTDEELEQASGGNESHMFMLTPTASGSY